MTYLPAMKLYTIKIIDWCDLIEVMCDSHCIYMRVEQKVLNKGPSLRRSWGMQLLVSAKVVFEMAKGNYFLAKDLAKVYVYIWYV